MKEPSPTFSSTTSALQRMPRRTVMQLGAGLLGLTLPQLALSAGIANQAALDVVRPFARYSDLLELLERRGRKWEVLGRTPDRQPVIAVRAGGDKLPAIFISAGAHSTEHAGVRAAVELIERLETRHQVFVLPCRDPMGLNDFSYALSLSLGDVPPLTSLDAAEALLRERGEVLFDAEGTLLVLIGEYGYANRDLHGRFPKGEKFLAPLHGRRIFFPARYQDVEGSMLLQRAYTHIVSPDGEVLHINRFHDTTWAPVESRCARLIMTRIKPGLTFDLHEHGGDGHWFSTRQQRTDADEIWEQRFAREMIAAWRASGAKLAEESYSPGSFFTKVERGVYALNAGQRGQGLNLIDYAARHHGPGFTIETGMRQPFADRVRDSMLAVQTAVKVFEERFA